MNKTSDINRPSTTNCQTTFTFSFRSPINRIFTLVCSDYVSLIGSSGSFHFQFIYIWKKKMNLICRQRGLFDSESYLLIYLIQRHRWHISWRLLSFVNRNLINWNKFETIKVIDCLSNSFVLLLLFLWYFLLNNQ